MKLSLHHNKVPYVLLQPTQTLNKTEISASTSFDINRCLSEAPLYSMSVACMPSHRGVPSSTRPASTKDCNISAILLTMPYKKI